MYTFIPDFEFKMYDYANLAPPRSQLTDTHMQLELTCAGTFEAF